MIMFTSRGITVVASTHFRTGPNGQLHALVRCNETLQANLPKAMSLRRIPGSTKTKALYPIEGFSQPWKVVHMTFDMVVDHA